MDALDALDLSDFEYVAVHAPSAMACDREQHIVDRLLAAKHRGWPIILHPDAVHEPSRWAALGDCLCIENMDKRKGTGRSDSELRPWFELLPEARFCLDLGHARQCDATMTEAYFLLKQHGGRLRQIHISEVTAASKHDRLSWSSEKAFQQVAHAEASLSSGRSRSASELSLAAKSCPSPIAPLCMDGGQRRVLRETT